MAIQKRRQNPHGITPGTARISPHVRLITGNSSAAKPVFYFRVGLQALFLHRSPRCSPPFFGMARCPRLPSMSYPLLLQRLRQETATAHQELEDGVKIQEVLQNAGSYAGLLASFWGFYAAAEAVFEETAELAAMGFQGEARRKSPWILEDLSALGWDEARIESLPLCPRDLLPQPEDTAGVLGCAYVIEGSTLGGRHISRLLESSPAIPFTARRFFQGYGPQTGERWKSFEMILESFSRGADEAGRARAAEAARQTFEGIGRWLVENPAS